MLNLSRHVRAMPLSSTSARLPLSKSSTTIMSLPVFQLAPMSMTMLGWRRSFISRISARKRCRLLASTAFRVFTATGVPLRSAASTAVAQLSVSVIALRAAQAMISVQCARAYATVHAQLTHQEDCAITSLDTMMPPIIALNALQALMLLLLLLL
jgi:hypothetical protein